MGRRARRARAVRPPAAVRPRQHPPRAWPWAAARRRASGPTARSTAARWRALRDRLPRPRRRGLTAPPVPLVAHGDGRQGEQHDEPADVAHADVDAVGRACSGSSGCISAQHRVGRRPRVEHERHVAEGGLGGEPQRRRDADDDAGPRDDAADGDAVEPPRDRRARRTAGRARRGGRGTTSRASSPRPTWPSPSRRPAGRRSIPIAAGGAPAAPRSPGSTSSHSGCHAASPKSRSTSRPSRRTERATRSGWSPITDSCPPFSAKKSPLAYGVSPPYQATWAAAHSAPSTAAAPTATPTARRSPRRHQPHSATARRRRRRGRT